MYGGSDSTAPLLATICQKKSDPVKIESSGNEMYVKFTSDSITGGGGFYATYTTKRSCKFISSESPTAFNVPEMYVMRKSRWFQPAAVNKNQTKEPSLLETILKTITKWTIACGPFRFSPITKFNWILRISIWLPTRLAMIHTLKWENTPASYNRFLEPKITRVVFVQVFDGPTKDYPLILKHCGNFLPATNPIYSTSNFLTVEMRSGSGYTAKGFKANYTMVIEL